LSGPLSSAPLNQLEFLHSLNLSIRSLRDQSLALIVTSVNGEAAKHNLPVFLKSCSLTSPPITSIIIFCLDSTACTLCHKLYQAQFCIYMNLGISDVSLAPGGTDALDKDYWKLTFGRIYANLAVHKLRVNIIAVDVDSIFLQNPLTMGNNIANRPNDIAVVPDVKPFTFKFGDKASINGGFLYLPGADPMGASFSRQLLDAVWEKNCKPKLNEQLVISSVLRRMTVQHRRNPHFKPHLLTKSQYLNFCSTTCGGGPYVFNNNNSKIDSNVESIPPDFKSVRSLGDLRRYEATLTGEGLKECGVEARKKWVYFHVACLQWNLDDKLNLSKKKGQLQQDILDWVHQTN